MRYAQGQQVAATAVALPDGAEIRGKRLEKHLSGEVLGTDHLGEGGDELSV